jgi:hypothetical protein
MDDALRLVGVFVACLIAPVLLGWGLVWLVSHYWLYLLASLVFVAIIAGICWLVADRRKAGRL